MKSCTLRSTWQIKPTEYPAYIAIYLLKKLLCRAGHFEALVLIVASQDGCVLPSSGLKDMFSTALLWWWDWPPPQPLGRNWHLTLQIFNLGKICSNLYHKKTPQLQSCDLSGNGGCGHHVAFREPSLALSLRQFSSYGVSCLFYLNWTCSLWNLVMERVSRGKRFVASTNRHEVHRYFCHDAVPTLQGKHPAAVSEVAKKLLLGFCLPSAKQALLLPGFVSLDWEFCWQHS